MKQHQRVVGGVTITMATLLSACAPSGSDDGLPSNRRAGKDQQARPREVTARETVVLVASEVNMPDDGKAADAANLELAPPRIAVSVADQLRLYLQSEFGTPGSEASWYLRIRRVAVGLYTATIHTDLSSNTRDRSAVKAICQTVSGFTQSHQGRDVTALDIDVLGPGGSLLASATHPPIPPSARIRPGTMPIQAPQHNSPIFPTAPSPEAQPGSTPTGDR